jgi:hypothetical protein
MATIVHEELVGIVVVEIRGRQRPNKNPIRKTNQSTTFK